MKRIFCGKIHEIFLLKQLFALIKREKELFEAAEWLKKIVCWLTKMKTPKKKNNGPSLIALCSMFFTYNGSILQYELLVSIASSIRACYIMRTSKV